ncbi:MAG: HypC/HybG/HupF family hydrogenase formation chaperone [Desulfomicrobium escambiense]|nr:HypC/HybG/HupF family hydrogenase formation chaperone [Desulfomicrobium escambiense]
MGFLDRRLRRSGEETVMCLGIPMLIVERSGNDAVVESGGVRKGVRLDLIETAAVGDYVLVHAGYAIEKLDTADALETLELIRQVYRAGRREDVT